MAVDKEKVKKALENVVYAEIGIVSAAGKLVSSAVDGFIEKGKEVAENNKDIDAAMKRVFNKNEEDEAKAQEEQHINEVLAALTPEEIEALKAKLQ